MSLITSNDRFAIFGARGMAGSAISRALDRAGYQQQRAERKENRSFHKLRFGRSLGRRP